jgi:hypothetical protein
MVSVKSPYFHSYVAEVKDEIIGMALYYYRYSTWKGKTIHLEDLIVKENHRGSRCRICFIQEIIEQGKKDCVRRIEWNVLDWNTPAIHFMKNREQKF